MKAKLVGYKPSAIDHRVVYSASLFEVASEHVSSICLLLLHSRTSSAAALLRSCIESAVRATWLLLVASDETFDDVVAGKGKDASMPTDLLRIIDAVRAGTLAPTTVILRGLEFDKVASSPAPGENARAVKPTDLSGNQLVMLGSLLGEPYGMAGEGARLVNDLIPNARESRMLTGNGSELRLGFHTENAAHRWIHRDRDLSPQGLLLTGICVPDENPPLTRVSNGRIAAQMVKASNPELYEALRTPCVRLALPIRQRKEGNSRLAPSPILSGKPGAEMVTAAFYGDMMEPLAEVAVAAYQAALEASAVRVLVEPGVVVYVPNGYMLHSRDAFVARFDPEGRANRWLQRIFVTARLDAFQIDRAVSERRFELTD